MYSRQVELGGNTFEYSWGGSAYGLLIKDITDSRISDNTFHHNSTAVYAQGATRVVASYWGNNSAPAWSPDGSRLAVTLTRDSISQIYVIPASGGEPRRMTTTPAIDTEASFSPDGKWIAFTSDRGGSPQIYRMPAEGGPAQRFTFEGTYNVRPRFSPDGKSIAFISDRARRQPI